jgi:hypothetical protein
MSAFTYFILCLSYALTPPTLGILALGLPYGLIPRLHTMCFYST